MTSATITITDNTQKPASLATLLSSTATKGYTVVPSTGVYGLAQFNSVTYLSIQASYTNGGATVYKGDENVQNNGTRQSKELKAGDVDVQQVYPYSVNLNEIFLTASANGAIVNVEVHVG